MLKWSLFVIFFQGYPRLCPRRIFLVWGCVKSLFMALRAKFKFETDVFFMILRSKIMKNTSVSKEYSAAEGGKNLFVQPQTNIISRGNDLLNRYFIRYWAIRPLICR